MTMAHDIHAETNSAFCAAVLAQFCEAHYQHLERKPAVVSAYLVLPIALSEDLAATFEGCNKSTGLLVWLERSPRVLPSLSRRVNATLAARPLGLSGLAASRDSYASKMRVLSLRRTLKFPRQRLSE